MPTPLVEVLLSTYDGERHVAPQIDSILAQVGVRVRLMVRDDGSRDGTVRVIERYAADPRVVVNVGPNLGLPQAFFTLLQHSGGDADYWAFADQDDIWLPHKLARGVQQMKGLPGAVLSCARVLVVDEQLQPLYPHPLPSRGPSFANALVQNIATGCTIMVNSGARDVLRDRWPSYAVMHDAWLYLVVSGTGRVVYDEEVVVHYRQHTSNVVGMGRGPVSRIVGRVRRQFTRGGPGNHGRQNAELARTHGDLLGREARAQLRDFLVSRKPLSSRMRYALRGAAHRQTRGSDLILKGLHVLDRV